MKDWQASQRHFENCWPDVYQAVNAFLRGEYQAPWPPLARSTLRISLKGGPCIFTMSDRTL